MIAGEDDTMQDLGEIKVFFNSALFKCLYFFMSLNVLDSFEMHEVSGSVIKLIASVITQIN